MSKTQTEMTQMSKAEQAGVLVATIGSKRPQAIRSLRFDDMFYGWLRNQLGHEPTAQDVKDFLKGYNSNAWHF